MSSDVDAIFQAAIKLPDDERVILLSRLLEAIPAPEGFWSMDDPALAEELERRFHDGEPGIPWDAVKAML